MRGFCVCRLFCRYMLAIGLCKYDGAWLYVSHSRKFPDCTHSEDDSQPYFTVELPF